MNVLLDEMLHVGLAKLLAGHRVRTVKQAGFRGMDNGAVLGQHLESSEVRQVTQVRSVWKVRLATLVSRLIARVARLGLLRWLRSHPQRRPTADELMQMDDSSFEEFFRLAGMRSAADLGVKANAPD